MDTFTPALNPQTPIVIRQTDPTTLVEMGDTLQAQIKRGWSALLSYRDITVNDRLLRVTDTTHESVTVSADIDYKAVVGARYCSAVAGTPYQALSALAVTVTSDKHIVLFVRDSGDWPRSYECTGGFVRARYQCATVEDFIATRHQREVGDLTVAHMSRLGIYDVPSIAEWMVVYACAVSETAATVQKCYPTAQLLDFADIAAVVAGSQTLSLPLHCPSRNVLQAISTAGLLE